MPHRPTCCGFPIFPNGSTWGGFVYVAFVINAFARKIVGWRASRSAQTGFVLDALEQALYDRKPVRKVGLVHHCDRGSQGRFNQSPQHPKLGGENGCGKAETGAINAAEIVLAMLDALTMAA